MGTLFEEGPLLDRERFATRLAALAQQQVFIGTSSWKYEGWLDQIYTRSRYMSREILGETL